MATVKGSPTGLAKLEEQITCPICKDHFTNPKVLPCIHSFCLDCLQRTPVVLIDGHHSLPCPTCRSPCPVPDAGLTSLPSSFVINSLMEAYELFKKVSDHQPTPCDNCDNSNADHYCKQCTKNFCHRCLYHHDNWKPNAGHQTISLELAHLPEQQSMVCSKHEPEPLKMFCETCQVLICRDCALVEHKDHKYEFIAETYQKHKDEIMKSRLQPLNKELIRLAQAKDILIDRRNEISRQAEAAKEDVHHTVAQIKNHLDETERKLAEDVDSAATHKISVLNEQLKNLDEAVVRVTDCRDHVDQCIKVGTAQQVLSTKPQMMSHSQSIINSVKDKTFQPLEQPDVSLVKSDNTFIFENIGKMKYTFFRPKLVNHSHSIPLFIGKKSSIGIAISHMDSSPAHIPSSLIKCVLNHEELTVEESSQSGQYDVVFTAPPSEGLYQLDVKYNGNPLGSVNVPVTVPPERRAGSPAQTITGLKKPSGVAVTDDGLVIVSEEGGHSINILDSEGKKIRSFGTKGEEKEKLQYPRGVAITSKGTILVLECVNHRIQEFSKDGKSISCVGTEGNGALQFKYPYGISVSKTTGQVFIADKDNHRVQVLNRDLSFSHKFGSEGSGQGHLKQPHDVTTDSQGFVYVTDSNNHRVQKFTHDGQFVRSIGAIETDQGKLFYPSGITVIGNHLYINNDRNQYVAIYSTDGEYIRSIDKMSRVDSSPLVSYRSELNGITCDCRGNLLVCCTFDNVIKLY